MKKEILKEIYFHIQIHPNEFQSIETLVIKERHC